MTPRHTKRRHSGVPACVPVFFWHITDNIYCPRCLLLIAYWNGFQNAPSIVCGTELCNYFSIVSLGATISSSVCVTTTSPPSSASVSPCSFSLCIFVCVSVCVCVCTFSFFQFPHLSTRCPLCVPLLYTPSAQLLISPCALDTCVHSQILSPYYFMYKKLVAMSVSSFTTHYHKGNSM